MHWGQNREETDLYLRQLEMENRVEEVYGKGVELIVPEAGFVVKTQDKVRLLLPVSHAHASPTRLRLLLCTSPLS